MREYSEEAVQLDEAVLPLANEVFLRPGVLDSLWSLQSVGLPLGDIGFDFVVK